MSAEITDKGSCLFSVWAPEKERMILRLANVGEGRGHAPGSPDRVAQQGRLVPMQKDRWGTFTAEIEGVVSGDLYYFQPDGMSDLPDPGSHHQPMGIHGPSAVVDHRDHTWRDGTWHGLPFNELIFYELHVGTFTREGSFDAIIPKLDQLAALGINAIELMPVNQFPGERNWGYDGVYPYAVQNSYGGPDGLKRLVDACHARGLSVFLDVVFNHFGPEGNYLDRFAPYFTSNYHTPWGRALNFDGPWSDGVRDYVIGNVLHWFVNYHLDGLRFDAIHEIYDRNALSIWEELHSRVRELMRVAGRPLYMVAESDLNSPRVIRPPDVGGWGFDAQWLDDFHHALYVFLDPEGLGHYRDFGRLEQLAKAFKDGYVHSGDYVQFRKRKHGASSAGMRGEGFVVFSQNHDLPGNRPGGERLAALVNFERLKLAAGAVLLSPYIPLLFMGEEYGERAPFYFFSDYGEKQVVEDLKAGRRLQFAGFGWDKEPPDPQDRNVFLQSKLQWNLRNEGEHAILLEWHRQLIRLRRENRLLKDLSKDNLRVDLIERSGLAICRTGRDGEQHLLCLFNLSEQEIPYTISFGGEASWVKRLDSKEEQWIRPADRTAETGTRNESPIRPGSRILIAPLGLMVYESVLVSPSVPIQ
ncbi:MAG: malto-oligosyltrehalose trehalohydrolase [Bacteroidota bacterium]|nr:malto-oligosyltrehalose trehalohydrolase [Bacteroidota bacterium]